MTMTFGTPDLIIVCLILLSVLIGIIRGFIKESISLVTWVSAVIVAVLCSKDLSVYMTFTKNDLVRWWSAFLIIFVGIIFVGAIVNFMVGALIRKSPFSMADRALGSIFGLLRGVVFVTILVLLGTLTQFPEAPWWKRSYMIGQFQELAVWLRDRLPEENAKVFHFPDEPKSSSTSAETSNKVPEKKSVKKENK